MESKAELKKRGQRLPMIILLCDNSKIERKLTYSYADLNKIDYLITEENISE